jgi:dUTP pyrophosphatase
MKNKDPQYYRMLQEKSMAARISRSFVVEFMLEPGAVLPWRSRQTDAGFDLHALENQQVRPGDITYIRTGVHLMPPPGYFFHIAPRSGVTKCGIIALNGIVDANYTGEILVPLYNTTKDIFIVTQNDRVAQAVFFPILHPSFENVNEFTVTHENHRGQRGFGSSGR